MNFRDVCHSLYSQFVYLSTDYHVTAQQSLFAQSERNVGSKTMFVSRMDERKIQEACDRINLVISCCWQYSTDGKKRAERAHQTMLTRRSDIAMAPRQDPTSPIVKDSLKPDWLWTLELAVWELDTLLRESVALGVCVLLGNLGIIWLPACVTVEDKPPSVRVTACKCKQYMRIRILSDIKLSLNMVVRLYNVFIVICINLQSMAPLSIAVKAGHDKKSLQDSPQY